MRKGIVKTYNTWHSCLQSLAAAGDMSKFVFRQEVDNFVSELRNTVYLANAASTSSDVTTLAKKVSCFRAV